MAGQTDLDTLLSDLRPTRRPGEFVYVTTSRPIDAEARIVEREAVTLILERAVADREGLEYEGSYAWLTLEVHSSLEAVGLTAAVSRTLADAGVPCNMLAGYYHDHALVPSDRADEALAALRRLSELPRGGR
ncbi:hypothetical protein BW730_16170 [Tessaracoccus aquimaris]|uniref:Uncharacterized protein n=1 Tax=Tessaracoccus aquimaris TaxID=1332264 RepID=A0A1Q2CRS4_9ACTN|nr:ACT domain-containing protein [Tessaracoccus aquimaris]AQP48807.1 hypothetical protein BW730_16170 [Tessaracoccus aquimaris]